MIKWEVKRKKLLNRRYKSLHVLPWIFQSSLGVHSLLSLASAKELPILELELLPSQTGPRHFLNMTVFSPQKRKIEGLFSKIRLWQFLSFYTYFYTQLQHNPSEFWSWTPVDSTGGKSKPRFSDTCNFLSKWGLEIDTCLCFSYDITDSLVFWKKLPTLATN